jgi:hypothetical protein
MPANLCTEATRLVELYGAAMSAFEHLKPQYEPFELKAFLDRRNAAHESLVRSREEYWKHVQSHRCSGRGGAALIA